MSSTGETAESLIERLDTKSLAQVIRKYGEERYAYPIAQAIHRWFRLSTDRNTVQLAQVIAEALPAKVRRTRNHHPATKTFQALRIQIRIFTENLWDLHPPKLIDLDSSGCTTDHSPKRRANRWRCRRDLVFEAHPRLRPENQ